MQAEKTDDPHNNQWIIKTNAGAEKARIHMPASVTTASAALAAYDTMKHELAADFVPPLHRVAEIIAERERRLAAGFDYDFGDARGVHRIGTTGADMIGWDEVTKLANARIAMGSAEPIAIVTDTGPAEVTPTEWQAVLLAASAFRQPIWAASFALQGMNPIPTDVADDQYWPDSFPA